MRVATVNSIEVSSLCNLKCPYCPADTQGEHRKVGLMSMDVFTAALVLVEAYAKRGTQLELNLFGIGEPLLHPNLVEMVNLARACLPIKQSLHLNTNGLLLTPQIASDLRDAGISSIDITGHSPYHTARAIRILQKAGIPGQLSVDYMTMPNNWAGQVKWFESAVRYPCPFLHRGQVMVMSNGDITTCCIDAHGKGIIGTVWGGHDELKVEPFELCRTCHQDIPEMIIKPEHGLSI